MKAKKISKKLVLNRNTIANINSDTMQDVLAGNAGPITWGVESCETVCYTKYLGYYCPLTLKYVCVGIEPIET